MHLCLKWIYKIAHHGKRIQFTCGLICWSKSVGIEGASIICPKSVFFLFPQNKFVCHIITRFIHSRRKFNDLLDSYKSEFPNKATFVLNNRETTVFVPSDESLRDFTTSDIASIKKDLTVLERVCFKEAMCRKSTKIQPIWFYFLHLLFEWK